MNDVKLKRGMKVLTPAGAGEIIRNKIENSVVMYEVKIYPKKPDDWTMKYWFTRNQIIIREGL